MLYLKIYDFIALLEFCVYFFKNINKEFDVIKKKRFKLDIQLE